MTIRSDHPIEAIDAGEPDARTLAHLAECRGCAGAAERAGQLSAALRRRETPEPPPDFTDRLMARVRGEHWQRERRLDLGFNVMLAVGLLLVGAGVWMLLAFSGLLALTFEVRPLLSDVLGPLGGRIAASAPTYIGAAGLITSALVVWWWADQRLSL